MCAKLNSAEYLDASLGVICHYKGFYIYMQVLAVILRTVGYTLQNRLGLGSAAGKLDCPTLF